MNAHSPGWYADSNDASQLRYWDGHAWTAHVRPHGGSLAPASVSPSIQPPTAPTGNWYFVVTFATVGLLAALPFFHAAAHLDRPQLRKTGAGMVAGSLLGCGLMAAAPTDDSGQATGWLSNVAVLVLLTVMLTATPLLIGLRREVYRPSAQLQSPTGNQGAMMGIEEARRRRGEARRLAAKDPMMARDLGIGRPESQQGYDDGGLLDLNLATAKEMSSVFGLPLDLAEEVVKARTALGRFLHVEDAVLFGQVSEDYAPYVRDRGLIISDG